MVQLLQILTKNQYGLFTIIGPEPVITIYVKVRNICFHDITLQVMSKNCDNPFACRHEKRSLVLDLFVSRTLGVISSMNANGTAIGVVCVIGAANRPDVPFVGMELSRWPVWCGIYAVVAAVLVAIALKDESY
jgi:hypothetical protein